MNDIDEYTYIPQKDYWAFFLKQIDAYKTLSYNRLNDRGCVFRKYVMVVNIELSTYCNRSCPYCPVSITKEKKNEFMEKSIFGKIIHELVTIGYRGHIATSLYNEPLADPDLCNKIQYIHSCLPHCPIQLNSNGDYLTRDLLEQLVESGGSQIIVTCHPSPNEKYVDGERLKSIEQLFCKLRFPLQITSFTPGKNITCDFTYKTLRILICANNWGEYGNDRGGTVPWLSKEGQEKPCMMPFREVVIGHDGGVRMCCNISTTKNNIGNVNDNTLLDIYFSKQFVDIRRHLLLFGEKMAPCRTCTSPDLVVDFSERETNPQRIEILNKAQIFV